LCQLDLGSSSRNQLRPVVEVLINLEQTFNTKVVHFNVPKVYLNKCGTKLTKSHVIYVSHYFSEKIASSTIILKA
jgi:hypothetical protein